MTGFIPQYSPWRHGGWYVDNVHYPSGAVGCVSRNFPDRKWRIACDDRDSDHTYPNRDAAARAEHVIALERHKTRESRCIGCGQWFVVPDGPWRHRCDTCATTKCDESHT